MALPLTSDLSALFNTDEFAKSVTYDGGTIKGVFDNETVPVEAGGFVQINQEQPRLMCKTADISSISEGQTMVIDGVTYNIRAWTHDGTGVSEVQLEKV